MYFIKRLGATAMNIQAIRQKTLKWAFIWPLVVVGSGLPISASLQILPSIFGLNKGERETSLEGKNARPTKGSSKSPPHHFELLQGLEKQTKDTGGLNKELLMSANLPPLQRYCFFQKVNLFLNLSITGSQTA